jgi:hypothetical protein
LLQRVGELRNNQSQELNTITSMENTKVVFVQALAYVTSFFITLSVPIANQIFILFAYHDEEQFSEGQKRKVEDDHVIILRMMIVLLPLQGLFNALIFVYHKIYNYRRTVSIQTIADVMS